MCHISADGGKFLKYFKIIIPGTEREYKQLRPESPPFAINLQIMRCTLKKSQKETIIILNVSICVKIMLFMEIGEKKVVFSSNAFLFLFLPFVLIVYFNPFFTSRTFKNAFLLLASLFFYAWGEPIYWVILCFSVCMNWFFGKMMGKREDDHWKKRIEVIAIVCNLSFLFVFKYLNFTVANIKRLMDISFPYSKIALPIGISFYTFQAISYIVDIKRKKAKAADSILDVGLGIACFPQLLAGPIIRYESIADEIHNRKETLDGFCEGLTRFVYGLAKKVIIANNIAQVADKAFSLPGQSVSLAWMGAVAYTLQIYFDFSGYSDMAIGLARIFGFHYAENFNYPYIAKSVTEFWHRWHISLSTWFRDYVYFPLGGSRVKSAARHIFNLGVVWLLTGIWHGANWTFILWGLVYFVVQIFEKYILKAKAGSPVIGRIYTMLVVVLCWVIFRSNSIHAAGAYIASMFGIGVTGTANGIAAGLVRDYWFYFAVGILASCPLAPALKKRFEQVSVGRVAYTVMTCAIFVLAISYMVTSSYSPFIYFNF